jgi:hypothetical protein
LNRRWLVVIGMLTGFACAPWAHASGLFCITTDNFLFGNQAVGSSASQSAVVSNCGDAPWSFTTVSVDPATEAGYHVSTTCASGQTLQPGATCTATVVFAPSTPGQVSGGLWLRNTTPDATPLLTFYGRGVDAQAGTAVLEYEPAVATFAAQQVGTQSPPLVLHVQNTGTAAMTLTAIVLNGPQAYDFSGEEDSCAPGTVVPAGQYCVLSLFFAPAAAGTRLANLVIDSPQLANLAILQVSGLGTTGPPPVATQSVVEYYYAPFDHYFLTPVPEEIALCDASVAPCAGWVRTGKSFDAYPATQAPASSVGVCRFFNDSFAPKSSHFYALHGLGCEQTLAAFPDWQLESSDLFNMLVPDAAGNCPARSVPVYRVYNNGMGGAPNHRFTTDLAVRAQMLAAGWVPEGNGIGVAFCSPQ